MSELLQIDNKFSTIAAFAEPFRLHGYDEFPGPLFRPPEPIVFFVFRQQIRYIPLIFGRLR
jgi:hypothetical protein